MITYTMRNGKLTRILTKMGRPRKLSPEKERDLLLRRENGETIASLASAFGVSEATVYTVIGRAKARAEQQQEAAA